MPRWFALRLPHPMLLLLGGVAFAALLTWVLPSGEYDRRDDPTTGRRVIVAGTYHRVEAKPVGPFRAIVAIPRGVAEAVEVVAVILFVGGAVILLERVGVLGRAITSLLQHLQGRGVIALVVVSCIFSLMGAIENMQEEIIGLVPVLLVLTYSLGYDGIVAVAISVGAAGVGSAFGPMNPFATGISLQLAQLPLSSAWGLRLAGWIVATAVWIWWTVRFANRHRTEVSAPLASDATISTRDSLVLIAMFLAFALFVYGTLKLGWGFNELSALFIVAALAIGLTSGMRSSEAMRAYLEGMKALLPAALLVGVARSISVVLTDGHVIDTILHGLVSPLGHLPAQASALLMIPTHAALHVPVPSMSGQSALTMPVMLPLADLLHFSRNAAILAYQTGAGLADILTPTNGAVMAILLAADVPWARWIRFALVGAGLVAIVGVVSIFVAIGVGMA